MMPSLENNADELKQVSSLDAEQAALAYRAFAFRFHNRPRYFGEGVRRESPVFREDLRYYGRVDHPLGRVVPIGEPHLLSDE
jgi:hypothetical protein